MTINMIQKNLNNIWEKLENQPIIFILESEQSDGVDKKSSKSYYKGIGLWKK